MGGVSSMCVLPQGVVGWHPPYMSLASRFGRELARSVQAEVGIHFLTSLNSSSPSLIGRMSCMSTATLVFLAMVYSFRSEPRLNAFHLVVLPHLQTGPPDLGLQGVRDEKSGIAQSALIPYVSVVNN